jgi:hypothetical protein
VIQPERQIRPAAAAQSHTVPNRNFGVVGCVRRPGIKLFGEVAAGGSQKGGAPASPREAGVAAEPDETLARRPLRK